jgi:aryl-alcohol dehydrogenase-like predicted oxidoreductase
MPLSMKHGEPEESDAIRTVHAALDAGITFVDTADIYAPSWDTMGANERIVGKALKAYGGGTEGIVVGTKGGITRSEGEGWGRDGSMEYLRKAVESSLRNLQVDVIDLYQWHRPDRWRLYADVIGVFKTLQDEGKIRAVGISNANVEEIEVAQQVLGEGGLASVQNEFSPNHPGSYDELQYTGEHGIAFLPWSPLGGTGGGAAKVGQRFGVFQEVGDAHGVSPQQVVLAWELALGDHVIPIPGASRAASITDSAKAADLQLSKDELQRISTTIGIGVA